MSDIWDKAKSIITSAGEKADELGKLGKQYLEIAQIERKRDRIFTTIGGRVYSLLVEENCQDIFAIPDIMELLDKANKLTEEIKEKKTK